jgi:hypothetical protein
VITLALLALAATCAGLSFQAWRRDRAVNGVDRRSGIDRLRALAALGRRTGAFCPSPRVSARASVSGPVARLM